MAVLGQIVGAVLLLVSVGLLWSWPVVVGVGGLMLLAVGVVAEMSRPSDRR